MVEKEKVLQEKTLAYEAIKGESDQTIRELRDQNVQLTETNENLQTDKERLLKERDELKVILDQKIAETNRLEEGLRGQLLHRNSNLLANNKMTTPVEETQAQTPILIPFQSAIVQDQPEAATNNESPHGLQPSDTNP